MELQTLTVNGGSEIRDSSLWICEKLTSVTICDSVTRVDRNAFGGATVVTADIPAHAIHAFPNDSLRRVTISSGEKLPEHTFSNQRMLRSITVGSTVTEIADGAFQNISETVTVNISPDNPAFMAIDNVIYTKDGTELVRYMPCKTEASFTVPSAVTKIRATAFCENRSLENVTMHDGVTEIGAYAFYKCESLKSISIPRGVTDISIGAFWRCGKLKTVALPEGINVIGMNAFGECSSLESVNIPSGVTVIGDMAFSLCSDLKALVLPDTVKEIGVSAFASCVLLEDINVPEGVTRIGNSAFRKCSSLVSISLPKSVTEINGNPFISCLKLESINVDADNTEYRSLDGNLYNKNGNILISYAIGKNDSTFEIPESVTSIGISAFFGCVSLTKITLPETVKFVLNSAFADCKNLRKVTVLSNETSIHDDAFYGCMITEATVPSNVIKYLNKSNVKKMIICGGDTIESKAFACCQRLESIVLCDSITSIGEGAFSGCVSLTSIDLGNGVTSVGRGVFTDCTQLKKIVLSGNFTYSEGLYDLKLCPLEDVTAPTNALEYLDAYKIKRITVNGGEEISEHMFDNYLPVHTRGLESLTIGSTVTKISDMALLKCPQLAEIKVAEDNPAFKAVDNVLYTKDGKTLVRYAPMKEGTEFSVSDNVTELFPYAFANARLKSVSLPSGLEKIGSGAFSQCLKIEKISIPEGIKRIEVGVFSGCAELSSVTLPKSLSVIGYKAFENCEKLQTLNYRGTQSEWRAVNKVEPFAIYNVVYEYDGE
jgi:hypothetical protein